MRTPDFVKKTGTLLVLLLGGGGLVGVSALFDVPKLVVEFFQWAIVEPPKPTQVLEVSTAGKVIIVIGIVALAAAGVWVFQRHRPSRDGLGEAGKLYDSIRTRGPAYKVSDVVMEIELTKDYSIGMRCEYTVEAVGSDLYAIPAVRASTDVPCPSIADVRFKAERVQGGGDLIAVVAADDPNEKKYLVFFDPPVRPGTTRRIRTSHFWPGSAKRTLEAGEWDRNGWTWPPGCQATVDSLKMSIQYPADGKRYETDPTVRPNSGPYENTHGWSGVFTNISPGMEIALKTRRT